MAPKSLRRKRLTYISRGFQAFEGMNMTDEMRDHRSSNMKRPSGKRLWTQPRIETVPGRDAQGSIFSYGGPDGGFYS
jgi:hypothetical protein